MDDTEEHQMLQGMVLGELVDMSLKYSYGDRNVKARFFGRAVGEIIIALAGFKGIPKALEALKGVSKAAKLEGIIGEISKGAKAVECLENGCFTGETLVETSTGLRRIDSLNEGDLVLSEDVKTGNQEYKKILTVYKKQLMNYM